MHIAALRAPGNRGQGIACAHDVGHVAWAGWISRLMQVSNLGHELRVFTMAAIGGERGLWQHDLATRRDARIGSQTWIEIAQGPKPTVFAPLLA